METQVRVEFEGMTASPELRAAVDHHVAELEKRFGRLTAGRIVVRGPGDHHQTGGQYQVSIGLALPEGREVSAVPTRG